MARRPLPVRLDDEMIARIDAVVGKLSKRAAGVEVTRSAVFRAALELGLKELEAGLKRRRTTSRN